MRIRPKKAAAVLAAGALAMQLAATAPPASASHGSLTIQVGARLGPRSLPANSMRFFGPRTITVHPNTVINFNFKEFHTATLLPSGVGADDWLLDNATSRGAYGFAQPDFDDGSNEFKDNYPAIANPTNPNCGGEGEGSCSYTGSLLNSGAPFEVPESFSVSVDVPAGTTFTVVDLIHHAVRTRISVSNDLGAVTTQSEIDQLRTSQLARDLDWAEVTHKKYNSQPSARTLPSGQKVYDVWAGVESRHVALYSFYPKRITVPQDARIRWRFDGLIHEDHTVSMPDPQLFFKLQFDESMCDPDGDSGPGPDFAPDSDPQTGEPVCPQGSELETDVSHQFWGGTGNGVLKSLNDVEHSGIRGVQAELLTPPAAGTGPFDVKFPFLTPEKPIKYFCFLHPMQGFVTVAN